MKSKISEILKEALQREVEISIPEREEFGHFSTNIAMKLSKLEKRPPLQIAEELQKRIWQRAPKNFFDRIEIAPPGFINFWLSPESTREEFSSLEKKNFFVKSQEGKGKRVIVEFASLNVAKPMHIGYLRNISLGEALANIYEALGYKVIRWNYVGDWGTQFGKLIYAYKNWGNKKKIEKNPIKELVTLYVKFHEEAEKNPILEDFAREEFQKLENGDKENRNLWTWFKKESFSEFEKILKKLDVNFDVEIGESFFEKEMKPLVSSLLKKKIAKKSEGSLIIPLEKFGLIPALIQKKDGASLYITRDIANLKYRLKKYNPEKILYVVGNEQSLHFEQLFAIAKVLGIKNKEIIHVKYGLIVAETGKKFSTREGRVVLLEDILEEAVKKAKKIVEKKNKELSSSQKEKIAQTIGIGALKYSTLRENANSTIVFDWNKILDLKGDSAPYIEYTYARLKSILRKAKKSGKVDLKFLETEEEMRLMRKIFEFSDEIQKSAVLHSLNNLTNYLFELATLANSFYEASPILKDKISERRAARLVLIQGITAILDRGLKILGIKTLEKI